MSRRFFVDQLIHTDRAKLTGAEAHHLAHVMRAVVGQRVVVIDGTGFEFDAEVRKLGKDEVELAVLECREVNRELPFSLTLGVALPKGDRQRWLVEKCVELGVTRIVPLRTERGVAQPAQHVLERLRRIVIESSKQSGRNRLAEIAQPWKLKNFFAQAPANAKRWIAHPEQLDGAASADGAPDVRSLYPTTTDVYLAVGPEGGFTEEELSQALEQKWHPICLGPRTLRIETAAIALVSLLSCGQTVLGNRGRLHV